MRAYMAQLISGSQNQKFWRLIPIAGHAHKCRAHFPFHTASVYPAMICAWWNEKT